MKKRILFTAAALVCAANLTAQCLGVGSSTSSMSPEEMAAAAKAEAAEKVRELKSRGMSKSVSAAAGPWLKSARRRCTPNAWPTRPV